jgi:predicted amidohydrolase
MKIAVVSHKIVNSVQKNIETMINYVKKAIKIKVDLILFSETATTGLINNNIPEHDLQLGTEIPGPITEQFSLLAKNSNIYIALGLFEHESNRLFDTAILIDMNGDIALKYHRISTGWHWNNSDPEIYIDGKEVPITETDLGKLCFLICGDLFDDKSVKQVKNLHPDILLFPFARALESKTNTQEIWNREELPVYQNNIRKIGITTLMSGYIDDEYIGGASVILKNGDILDTLPLHQEGMLVINISNSFINA